MDADAETVSRRIKMAAGRQIEEQMDIYDSFKCVKRETPEMWECMKTCENADVFTDTFPANPKVKRCVYGIRMDGTSGNDMREETRGGTVRIFCKYYKRGGQQPERRKR